MADTISFFLNGEPVTLDDPSPDLLLIEYLRSADVGLTGAKKGCGQGGCGACTVLLSTWDDAAGRFEHRSINSCLRPVCSLDGMVVTTIEGTGQVDRPAPAHLAHATSFSRAAAPATFVSPGEAEAVQAAAQARSSASAAAAAAADEPPGGNGVTLAGTGVTLAGDDAHNVRPAEPAGMNSVAYRLAMNNGTQCGYCSAGFVMNMCGLLTNRPEPTKREIQDAFDGNLCRCTGYRPILTGMETFAKDWTAADEQRRMKCLAEGALNAIVPATELKIPLPPADQLTTRATRVDVDDKVWVRPATRSELGSLLREFSGRRVRMVDGNTSYGCTRTRYARPTC